MLRERCDDDRGLDDRGPVCQRGSCCWITRCTDSDASADSKRNDGRSCTDEWSLHVGIVSSSVTDWNAGR
jgi:hypothetical protein